MNWLIVIIALLWIGNGILWALIAEQTLGDKKKDWIRALMTGVLFSPLCTALGFIGAWRGLRP